LQEAARLGFKRAVVSSRERALRGAAPLAVTGVSTLKDALKAVMI
jgi:predicted ATP-dependent serine protease